LIDTIPTLFVLQQKVNFISAETKLILIDRLYHNVTRDFNA